MSINSAIFETADTEDDPLKSSSPSQLGSTRPATTAGFSFISTYGDMKGTKYFNYKPAKLHDKGKWFVWYSYRNPESHNFDRFKVYEGINRIKDESERRKYAKVLIEAINYGLKDGYNPFEIPVKLQVVHKENSLVQGLNYFKTRLHDRGLRKRTIQSYESVIRNMYAGLKPVLLDDIKTIKKSHIESFLRQTAQRKNWSNATYNNNLTFIKSIFNYLIEQEILETSPAHRVKPLPSISTRNRYFDTETFEMIKQKAPADLLRFLMFLYHTGTRPNEARQLEYRHIDRGRKLLFVPAHISKNKKDDYVPLSDYVIQNYYGTGLIFGSSVNFYTQKFSKLKKELKLPKEMTLYSIKHTAAISMARRNVPPYAMMQFFRHSSLEVTMSYLRDLGTTISREAVE